jgi:predicted extracellular nuclease
MKKLLLSLLISVLALTSYGQCTELFISEYVEGSHNNKALEIYNPTSSAINLSGYRIARYNNGSTAPQFEALTGTLAAADVLVIVLDKQNPAGTGVDTIVFAGLRAVADVYMSAVYPGPMYFNGNDAVSLEKTNGTYVDLIGVVGQDPGIAWTADTAAGFTSALGGRWWTANKTLVRKSTVKQGITGNPIYFNPAAEWDTLVTNTFTNLGWHVCECTPNSIGETAQKIYDAFMYPNPTNGQNVTLKATQIIESVTIYDLVGKEVNTIKNASARGDINLPTSNLPSGIYMVNINFDDNKSIVKKLIVR